MPPWGLGDLILQSAAQVQAASAFPPTAFEPASRPSARPSRHSPVPLQAVPLASGGAQSRLRGHVRAMGAIEANGNGAGIAGKDLKVEALREQMRAADGGRGVDAYIIPSEDPHMVRQSLCLSPVLNHHPSALLLSWFHASFLVSWLHCSFMNVCCCFIYWGTWH